MAPICRARLLSDLSGQTVCDKEATSSDGRLCAFHSRQCQGKPPSSSEVKMHFISARINLFAMEPTYAYHFQRCIEDTKSVMQNLTFFLTNPHPTLKVRRAP